MAFWKNNLVSGAALLFAGAVRAESPRAVSFANDVVPALTRAGCNQGTCHGAAIGKNGFKLSLRGFAPELDYLAITRELGGRRVNKLEPERSLLLRKPLLELSHMGGLCLRRGAPEHRIITAWLAQGAPGPSASDARVTRLEILRTPGSVKRAQSLPLRVFATFSNGERRDVTHWARFGTNDENVAAVNADGIVRVLGEGETAVTAAYQDRVAMTRVTSPYGYAVNPSGYSRLQRANYIDSLIYSKLKALNLWPSSSASDREFIRRVTLDLVGLLPSPDEVDAFVRDRAPNKRARLVSRQMARPEFVDFWTYKWGDLFKVNRGTLKDKGMWAFYAYLHDSVRDNKPWDALCREILTATGNTFLDGPPNYFRTALKPEELTENVSQGFLGIRVGCARCHNHPLEKWTQNDYYGMASIFARVKWKADIAIYRNEEMTVYNAESGEIDQPRLGKPMPCQPLGGPRLNLAAGRDRRLVFADWLTRPDNPWFARSFVNRVWAHLMGRGIVDPVDDMRETNPPANPELLDALAADFVRHRFDVRYLIRTILASQAYQRSSSPGARNAKDDRYFSRYFPRRLTAEVILDTVSQVTGQPEAFPGMPAGLRAIQLPDTQVKSEFMDSFGRPARQITCDCERSQEPSMAQALLFINGEAVNRKVTADGALVDRLLKAGLTDTAMLNTLYRTALGRSPAPGERAAALKAVSLAQTRASVPHAEAQSHGGGAKSGEGVTQGRKAAKESPAPARALPPNETRPTQGRKDAEESPVPARAGGSSDNAALVDHQPSTISRQRTIIEHSDPASRRRAFEDLLWVLLNSKEFLFNH